MQLMLNSNNIVCDNNDHVKENQSIQILNANEEQEINQSIHFWALKKKGVKILICLSLEMSPKV